MKKTYKNEAYSSSTNGSSKSHLVCLDVQVVDEVSGREHQCVRINENQVEELLAVVSKGVSVDGNLVIWRGISRTFLT